VLKTLRSRSRRTQVAARLCASLSARARESVFFTAFRIADTIDGRFDMLVLHAWLVLERLTAQGRSELAQSLVDTLFARLDEALREQGAGDIGMGRRMKKMAGAFYGRLQAYDSAGEAGMAAALVRNVWRGDASCVERAAGLAKYVMSARASLAQSNLAEGEADFGPLPPIWSSPS
jgi:cytochrome b pre-mRNA-processing protein 3